MGKRGPKTLLTPELQDKFCALISHGVHMQHAAPACGVSYDITHDWRQRGRRGDPEYVAFWIAVDEALAIHAANMQQGITRHADKDWKAAAWDLERRYPKLYGAVNKHEVKQIQVQQGVEQVLEAVREHMTDEAYDELVRAVVRVQDSDGSVEDGEGEQE